jgi:SelR domain
MAAHSGSGFDLTPPSPEQRKLLEADLTAEEANVLLRHATEAPFCGAFLDEKRPGVFTCRLCGLPLFLGGQKFESGTAGRASRRPSTTITCVKSVTQVTAWRVRSFSAPAAAATRGTCSPTARRPRACATASTPCL